MGSAFLKEGLIMHMRLLVATAFAVLSPAAVAAAEPARDVHESKPWKAGIARVSITPENLMWMSGYANRKKPAEGKLHDLWAKVLVLEDPQGRRAVLVTMDLVGIPRDLSQNVCQELQRRYKLEREAVVLNVSHTHTGPVVGNNLLAMYDLDENQLRLVSLYAQGLQKKLVSLVGDGLRNLAPAQIFWGTGEATFAVNRRNNKEADVSQLRAAGQLKGPVDHEVPVLAIRDLGDRLKAIVCGYACHATVLDFQLWSGDYPGFAQLHLEKAHPETVAIFWAGCGADQNPLPRRQVSLAEEYGHQLAESVEKVLQKPMNPLRGGLATSYREIDLPFADLPTRDQLVKDTMSENQYVAARAKLLLKQIERDGMLRGTYPYPVQVWQLGTDVTFVALGGEVVVDYALRLKKELGPKKTWLAGYSNDVMAYIPSLRVLKEGGYEGGGAMVYYGLPARWESNVEELIVAAVHEEVEKVRHSVMADNPSGGSTDGTHRAEQQSKADLAKSEQETPPAVSAIHDRLGKYITAHEIAGAVTLVATPDRIVHLDATGNASLNPREAMRTDTIFWIASMSKPVLATLLLMLQDEGLLSVDDSVEKYLPEFKGLKTVDGKLAPITIRHLLTHTSGMGEITADQARACKTLASVIPLYVAKPVAFTPGSKWVYCQSGINTGGRIAEVVTGEPLEKLLKRRLFDPLGMHDTTFYLTEEQLPRLAKSYRRTDNGDLEATDIAFLNGKSPTSTDRFPAPNGGLFSTASDYARFCQMVLRGGELDGKRYLKPETVKLMTKIQTAGLKTGFTEGNGWGLGWCVVREPQGITAMLSPGTFGHGGAYGTQAWIDPTKKRIYILMVQRANFPNSDASEVRRGFQEAASEALSNLKSK